MKLKNISFTIFVTVIVVSLILVFLSGFTRYIFAKDYYFFVENPCDETTQTCYIRSCDDYCPPNKLEIYSLYRIKASLFENCNDNSCQNICERGQTSNVCEYIPCIVSEETECSSKEGI